jgi:hypothetical protein
VAITVGHGSPKFGIIQVIQCGGVKVLTEKGQHLKIPLLALNVEIEALEKCTPMASEMKFVSIQRKREAKDGHSFD